MNEIVDKKPRVRAGGRKKGTLNKRTLAVMAATAESGITPLAYLLSRMRAPMPKGASVAQQLEHTAQCTEAAKAAAPYVHPKLSAVEMSGGLQVNHESALDELE